MPLHTQFPVGFWKDAKAPTVVITSNASEPVSAAFMGTATFSEAVTGFVVGDITVANATISEFATADNIIFTFTVTPDWAGDVSLRIAAGVCQDTARNENAASETVSVTIAPSPDKLSNLLGWLDASTANALFQDAGVTPAGVGDPVGQWVDMGGLNFHATQTTLGNKPTVTTINNLPAVDFDGSGDFLSWPIGSAASDYTFLFVVATDATSNIAYFFDAALGRLIFAYVSGSGDPSKTSYYDGSWHDVAPKATALRVVSFVMADPVGTVYRDGVSIGTGTYTKKALGGSRALGAANTGAGSWVPGTFCEVVAYSRGLSMGELLGLNNYLIQKWGI